MRACARAGSATLATDAEDPAAHVGASAVPRSIQPPLRLPTRAHELIVGGLRHIGILRDDDAVVFSEARLVRPANVIFDLGRATALAIVHDYLDHIGVHYCGRYGNWDHSWTDEAFESGEHAARAALGR
jgi:hypothetical protein